MGFINIQTSRLIIRRLKTEDAETVAFYRSLPEITRFQSSYTLDRAIGMILEMSESDPSISGRWFQFGIELFSEHRLIGDIGVLNSDESGKSWIGFTLDPAYWKKGYAVEAVWSVLKYYHKINIRTIWASTDPKNANSMRLLNKIGFRLVESKPEDIIFVFSGEFDP